MGFTPVAAPSLRRAPTTTLGNLITPSASGVRGITTRAAAGYNTSTDYALAVEDPTGVAVAGVGKYGKAFFQGQTADAASATTEFWYQGDTFPKVSLSYSPFGASVQLGTGSAAASSVLTRTSAQLWNGTESNPRLKLDTSSDPTISFGTGAAAADITVARKADRSGLTFSLPAAHSNQFAGALTEPISIQAASGRSGMTHDGTSGGTSAQVTVWSKPGNATNGPRGDSITTDSANGGAFSQFAAFAAMSSSFSTSYDQKGSHAHFFSWMQVDPYAGGGDVYCEAMNIYGALDTRRKGAFSTNMELANTVSSGTPARVAVARLIVQEANAASAYNSATFGAGSRYIATGGAVGLEIVSQGAQPGGTGISFWGFTGFRTALGVFSPGTTTLVSGIDGLGGVFTRTKAGAPVDGDFRDPRSGMLAVDTTNSRLYVRVGSTWKSVVVA